MPTRTDVIRQREAHKKLLPDPVDIWSRPVGASIDTGAYAYASTNRCRVTLPMNNPRSNIYNESFSVQDASYTEDERLIEIGWDAVVGDGDQLYVTERASNTITQYTVLHRISDLSNLAGILVKAQKK
jgi:hypothetical protein